MAKPDNRADNAEKLQTMVQNTIENMEESEQYFTEHANEISNAELQSLQQKNQRREESIEGFRSEIKDETKS